MAAPWDGRLITYLGVGEAADRPAAPNIAEGILAFWYANDTGTLSLWDSGVALAWTDFPSYSLEQIQDIVGAMIVNSASVELTYDDGTGEIGAEIATAWLGTQLAEGANIELTTDPMTGVVTVAVTGISSGATELDDLTDVDTTSTPPAEGNVLVFRTDKFVPEAPAVGVTELDDLSDVDTTTDSPAEGDLLVFRTDKFVPEASPHVVLADQAAYDALSPPDADTFYYIPEA